MSILISIIINTRNRKSMLFALLNCIYKQSLIKQSEVIVVDDFSDEDYTLEITDKYKGLIFIRNDHREFLIKSRNKGWQKASGRYVFFIDDDNEINNIHLVKDAIAIFDENSEIGIVGCCTYYFEDPTTIQMGPNKFNKYTGKTNFILINQKVPINHPKLMKTHDNPNAFFTKLDLLHKVNGFSPEIVQTFSEADYSEKVRKLGFEVVQALDLKVFHKSTKVDYKNLPLRLLGGSPERFYYLMRNRFLFIKKYGNLVQKLSFGLFFSWIYNFYYLYITLKNRNWVMFKSGMLGILHGYIILLFGLIPNNPIYAKK